MNPTSVSSAESSDFRFVSILPARDEGFEKKTFVLNKLYKLNTISGSDRFCRRIFSAELLLKILLQNKCT